MRLLVLRLSSFGDVVFTLPLAKALKESLGGPLAWAVEPPLASLLEGASYVDEVLPAGTRTWRRAPLARSTRVELGAFLRSARAFRPDVLVDAQGLFKSAWAAFLIPAGRKVGFGFGTATEGVSCLALDERVDARRRAHVADRALALAEYLIGRNGFDRRPDVRHLVNRPDAGVDAWLAARGGSPFALLQPFASKSDKEWAAEHVVAFARTLAEREGLASVIRWGPGERARAEELVDRAPDVLGMAPATGPASSARLAAAAALFAGCDTGPTHLAAAAGTPTLALFGPTDPARFGPIGPAAAIARLETPVTVLVDSARRLIDS